MSFLVSLLNGFLMYGMLIADPSDQLVDQHNTDQPVTKPQRTGDFHHSVTESLQVHTANCTSRYFSLNTSIMDDAGMLLTFTSKGHLDVKAHRPQTCRIHLTSHSRDVIWIVLLEHSLCGGGVFVFLSDGAPSTQWDVCSVWHSPGPDMMTSTSVADLQIEINDVIDLCKFTLYVKPVRETPKDQLEVHYLSATEGGFIFFHFVVCLFFFCFFFFFFFCFLLLLLLLLLVCLFVFSFV